VPQQDFTPAFARLIDSGRRSLGVPPDSALPALSAHEWQALPDAAERHGMTAWVRGAVPEWAGVPAQVRDTIESRARAQQVRALDAVAQLATVAGLLHDARIDAVSLKGPLFSRWLYGDLGTRRFVDLDLLVAPADRERTLRLLAGEGYALAGGLSLATARAVYRGTGAWPLAHATALGVDLHWTPQAAGFGAALEAGDILRDRVPTAAGGRAIGIPAPTHAATLTLLHAAKHLWASLELVLSIAHLMRRRDVDWAVLQGLAARAGAWTGAAAGLALAAEIFGVDVPIDVSAGVRSPRVRRLVAAARGFLAMPDVAGASLRDELGAHWAARDGVTARGRYAAWRLLAPTPLEAAWLPLPDGLAAFYAPVRLIRLLTVRRRDGARGSGRSGPQ
jgi:hypothetical protein